MWLDRSDNLHGLPDQDEMDLSDHNRGTKRKYSGDKHLGASPDDVTSARHSTPPFPDHTTTIRSTDVDRRDEEYYRTLYDRELNFRVLGKQDAALGALLQGGGGGSHLDFADPHAVMQLTKTLLRLDFSLRIELPLDRLCPPVPNRHNYVLWLKDLVDSSSPSYSQAYEPERRVTGLDIGTGASLIYPLLACAQRPAWSFVATDVDAKSLAFARRNVELNNLQSRVRVEGRHVDASLVPLDELGIEAMDFVMVNPPFYTSEFELLDLARLKSRPPNSACTGAPIEMVCEGGEVGFVSRIIEESLELRTRVQWYTSMLGKQSSLDVLIGILVEHGIDNYAVTAFVQGNKTRRWALGWSFGHRRPSVRASRSSELTVSKRLLPFPTESTVIRESLSVIDIHAAKRVLCEAMESLSLVSWEWDVRVSRGVGFADGNVWSRSYRRRKERQQQATASSSPQHHDVSTKNIKTKPEPDLSTIQKPRHGIADCAFGFTISVQVERNAHDAGDRVVLVVRWLQGRDYQLFESFTGMIRNTILRLARTSEGDQVVAESASA